LQLHIVRVLLHLMFASEMTYTVSGGALNSTQSNDVTFRRIIAKSQIYWKGESWALWYVFKNFLCPWTPLGDFRPPDYLPPHSHIV